MSGIEFRQPTADDLAEFLRLSMIAYGSDATDAIIAVEERSNELDRSYGAFENAAWVGGSGAYSFELTMPGGAILSAAGVSMIGVSPTHRRRGILTEMMRWLHADARRRNEPIALLTASESSIYRRFGYGIVADVVNLRIPATSVRFSPPVEAPGGFELVDPHVDTSELAAVYDTVRRERHGWLSLNPGMWDQIRIDEPALREGRTPLRAVLHRDATGTPDGFALWRIKAHEEAGRVFANTLFVEWLVGANPEVEAALWEFVASIDLVTTVVWENGPTSPAIRWRLEEPRQLHIDARSDLIWARLLDVAAVLSARPYGTAGTLILEVNDPFLPEAGGRFRLTSAGPESAGECERLDDIGAAAAAKPDLIVNTADLASLALGMVSASTLAAARRITAQDDAALALADALFATPTTPWCPVAF